MEELDFFVFVFLFTMMAKGARAELELVHTNEKMVPSLVRSCHWSTRLGEWMVLSCKIEKGFPFSGGHSLSAGYMAQGAAWPDSTQLPRYMGLGERAREWRKQQR